MAYRGKYPTRINTVYSVSGAKGIRIQLNNGSRYDVIPLTRDGRARMPKPNDAFGLYADNLDYSVDPVIEPGIRRTFFA